MTEGSEERSRKGKGRMEGLMVEFQEATEKATNSEGRWKRMEEKTQKMKNGVKGGRQMGEGGRGRI